VALLSEKIVDAPLKVASTLNLSPFHFHPLY